MSLGSDKAHTRSGDGELPSHSMRKLGCGFQGWRSMIDIGNEDPSMFRREVIMNK